MHGHRADYFDTFFSLAESQTPFSFTFATVIATRSMLKSMLFANLMTPQPGWMLSRMGEGCVSPPQF
jgi:hypothetical protein